MEASWNVLEASRSVSKRLGALLQAIWPDTENVEKPLVFLVFWSMGRSWGTLGPSWRRLEDVLEPSWSCLGAAAPAAAPDAACVGVPAALGRSWTALEPLLAALGAIRTLLRL